MQNSVVHIESETNNSFGTGFVIDIDSNGSYILTCQHIVDDVISPVVQGLKSYVVSDISFIDMVVLYVKDLELEPLFLQIDKCNSVEVEVIGFSHFNQDMTQKEQIKATLYDKFIELHSNENNTFYNVRKIKAKDGFHFDRGNSGSPVICKQTDNVIAMVTNKEGGNIAYAIDIANLNKVWNKRIKVSKREYRSTISKDVISFFIIISFIVGIYFLMS